MYRFRPFVLFSLIVALIAGPLLSMAQAQEGTPEAGRTLPPIVWRTKTAGNLGFNDRPAAIADGRIYIVDPDGTLTARNMRTGSVAWEIETGLENTFGPISVSANDDLVAVVRGGEMRVFDDNNMGAQLWSRTVINDGDFFPTAIFHEDLLITNEVDLDVDPHSIATVYGLAATTGDQDWEYVAAGGLSTYDVPVSGDFAVVSLSDGHVEVIDMDDGSRVRQFDAQTTGYTAPFVVGDVVIAQGETSAGRSIITAFSLTTGAELWNLAEPGGFLEGIVGSSAIVTMPAEFDAAGTSAPSIHAFDITNGMDRGWVIEDASVTALATGDDGDFLATTSTDPAGNATSDVRKIDPTSGLVEWTLRISSPSLSLTTCGNKLYVRHGAFVASAKQSDGTVVYDYAVGQFAPSALCNGLTLAATIGADGVVAVHDTEVNPNLNPNVSFDSRIRRPFFITRPIRVPASDNLLLGVWRGQVSADSWVPLPPEVIDLNLFVEEGSIDVLLPPEADGQEPLIDRVNAGEVFAVPEGGSSIRAVEGSAATLYAAGLLPEEVANRIGIGPEDSDEENTGEEGTRILPTFEAVGAIDLNDPPPDDVLQITVTTLSPEINSGSWPRLSSWPATIIVTSGSLEIPTAPGVQQPEEQRSIAAYDRLLQGEDTGDVIPSETLFSAVSESAEGTGLLVMVDPTSTVTLAASCAGRCFIR